MKKSHLIASAVATGLFCSAVSHAGGLVGGFGGGVGGALNGGLGSNMGNMGSIGGMGSLGGSMNGGGAFNTGSDGLGRVTHTVSPHSAERDAGKAVSATRGDASKAKDKTQDTAS